MSETHNIDGISYSVCGSGPAIVFLHGFLESKAIWDDFANALQNQFTVVCIDLPGHGESALPDGEPSIDAMALAVNKVFEKLDLKDALIVGHSLGGYVASAFAQKFEYRLSGLVFFHSHAAPDSAEAKENRRRTINIVQQDKGGFIRQFIPDLFDKKYVANYTDKIEELKEIASHMTADAIVYALAAMRDRPGTLQYLLVSDIPVMFIIGKQDTRMPYNQVLAQAVIPAHSEIVLLEDVAHMGYIEAASKTLEAIRHFGMRVKV